MRQAFPVSNGYAPQNGPRALPISLDFTNQTFYQLDLVQEVEADVINIVQSIYVDNSANLNPVTFLFDQTNQRLVIPAGAQGTWPVITPKDAPRFVVSTTQAAVVVNFILLNVPMAISPWGPIAVTVQNVNATFAPTVSNSVDRGAVGTGADAVLMPANGARKRIQIENPSTAVASIFINFGAAATTNPGPGAPNSFEIMPGGYYDSSFGPVDGQAVHVFANLNALIIAKEW